MKKPTNKYNPQLDAHAQSQQRNIHQISLAHEFDRKAKISRVRSPICNVSESRIVANNIKPH